MLGRRQMSTLGSPFTETYTAVQGTRVHPACGPQELWPHSKHPSTETPLTLHRKDHALGKARGCSVEQLWFLLCFVPAAELNNTLVMSLKSLSWF